MSIQFTPPPCVISQDEQWTGWYWENPSTQKRSKIYCKQIVCNNLAVNGSKSYPHNIQDIDVNGYIDVRGVITSPNGWTYAFPRADVVGNTSVCVDVVSETDVYIIARWPGATIHATLTLYYTKLSD